MGHSAAESSDTGSVEEGKFYVNCDGYESNTDWMG